MTKLMVLKVAVALGVLLQVVAVAGGRQPKSPLEPRDAGKLRIGVYDARAVAVAYVRGNGDAEQIRRLQAELKQADAGGQADRSGDIRARGERLQTLRHLQGFAGARIDDILPALRDRLPGVAAETGVAAIVDKIDFADDRVEAVDVTHRIVAHFKPDAQTLRIIADLRKQKPLPMLDALAMSPAD